MNDSAVNRVLKSLEEDYRITEAWILFYAERKREYLEDAIYIREETQSTNYLGKTGTSLNSFTEYKIVQLSSLEINEKWLITIEMMELTLSPKKEIFLEMRRRAANKNMTLQKQGKGKINWILFVQRHYAEYMSKKYNCPKEKFWLSEKTIQLWWKGIVGLTRLMALKRNCIF